MTSLPSTFYPPRVFLQYSFTSPQAVCQACFCQTHTHTRGCIPTFEDHYFSAWQSNLAIIIEYRCRAAAASVRCAPGRGH